MHTPQSQHPQSPDVRLAKKCLCGVIGMVVDRKDGKQKIIQGAVEGQQHSEAVETRGLLVMQTGCCQQTGVWSS